MKTILEYFAGVLFIILVCVVGYMGTAVADEVSLQIFESSGVTKNDNFSTIGEGLQINWHKKDVYYYFGDETINVNMQAGRAFSLNVKHLGAGKTYSHDSGISFFGQFGLAYLTNSWGAGRIDEPNEAMQYWFNSKFYGSVENPSSGHSVWAFDGFQVEHDDFALSGKMGVQFDHKLSKDSIFSFGENTTVSIGYAREWLVVDMILTAYSNEWTAFYGPEANWNSGGRRDFGSDQLILTYKTDF